MSLVLRALSSLLSSFELTWSYLLASEMWVLRERRNGRWEVIESRNFELWQGALLEWFGPQWNDELREKHYCAYYGPDQLSAFLANPTFHEQLEAARELSAWLDEREAKGELDGPTLAQLRATLR